MTETSFEVQRVIARARLTMRTVTRALEVLLTSDDFPARAESWNQIAVFGRAVTNVLQNLRTYEREDFNSWYAPWKAEMLSDPLCRFFYESRTRIIKDGQQHLASAWKPADSNEIPGPPVVVHPTTLDNGEKRVYWLMLMNSPREHLGRDISREPMEAVTKLYVEYLARMVREAEIHFVISRSD